MTSTKKDPILVVVQLSGGNDGINTVVPYGDPTTTMSAPAWAFRQSRSLTWTATPASTPAWDR